MSDDVTDLAEQRVLVVAPTTRDGEVTRALLAQAGLCAVVYSDLACACDELRVGASALVLTAEALASKDIGSLVSFLENQASWSDLPIVLLQSERQSGKSSGIFPSIGNVTILERPAPSRSVVSAIQTAVRARQRQYQIRDHLAAIIKAERDARELREQLAIALEASELGTFHCPLPLGRIEWNEQCKAHFGLGPEADVDFDLYYSLIHPEDRESARIAIDECVCGAKPYKVEYRVVHPDGNVRWIRATGKTFYDEENKPIRFDGTTEDITERKEAEKALLVSRGRFEAMANSIPQLAWMANPDGWIFWYNQRWHSYCGTRPEDMEGWGWKSVHDPKELPRVMERWQAALHTCEPWEDSFPLRRFDGEYRWHLSRAMPFRDDTGNVIFWFGTNTDITEERNRAETRQQLLESERRARTEAERVNLMKDEFLATLSHELRTPLNAIFGWAQLLKMDQGDPAMVKEGIEVIDRNVRAQTQLIEDLLDMSRIMSGKVRLDVQLVDLPELINNAIESVRPAADAKSVRLDRILDPLAGPVSGDPNRLQQVLWNLLTNAIKFTPRGGRVQVVLERVNSHVQLSVVDSGEGIEPGFLPQLFERFSQADGSTTRKHGGLGLGLSIVKNLVELHGGTIHAKSAGEGQGSTFVIQLPLRVTKAVYDEVAHPRASKSAPDFDCRDKLTGLKVLVVDDEPDARALVNRFLAQSGATSALAGSAVDAHIVLESFAADVIVSDIGMPDQDGYDFIRARRNSGDRTPAVALTAFARAEDRIRSIQAGFQAHLPKPIEPAELIAVIASLAGRFN